MLKLAIFASGSGTNAENIIKYFANHKEISIELVLANKADAFVLERAKKLQIPAEFHPNTFFRDGEEITKYLKSKGIDYVILAGFLLMIPEELVKNYPGKIINIHPALLPKYGGKGMYGGNVHKAVIEAKEKESGITIHYVNEKYDEGKVIFQAKCSIDKDDTPETLAKKIHALEYEYFPKILERVCL